MSDSHQEIKTLEISLHQQDIRRSKESLELLLHPLFKEVGYSGVTYNLKSILEALKQDIYQTTKAKKSSGQLHRLRRDGQVQCKASAKIGFV